jgi:tetratricopeptide (TPR) repeat protein
MVKQFDKALECFNRILQSDPDHLEATYNVGIIYQAMKQPEKSIGYFLKCLQINPNTVPAYEQLIRSYQIIGDRQKAEFYRQQLAEIKNR